MRWGGDMEGGYLLTPMKIANNNFNCHLHNWIRFYSKEELLKQVNLQSFKILSVIKNSSLMYF